jgi:hypothetical protein
MELEASAGQLIAKLKLKFKVDSRRLKVCTPEIVPSWSWKWMKNEKWLVHYTKEGKLFMRRVGETS